MSRTQTFYIVYQFCGNNLCERLNFDQELLMFESNVL